jgi:hypothetical protein
VCCGVCTDLDVCVPFTVLGFSDDLWLFSTSTYKWKRVYLGTHPGRRAFHTMTCVGMDLWVHGGMTEFLQAGEGDTCVTHVTLLLLLHLNRDCTSLNLAPAAAVALAPMLLGLPVTASTVVCYGS